MYKYLYTILLGAIAVAGVIASLYFGMKAQKQESIIATLEKGRTDYAKEYASTTEALATTSQQLLSTRQALLELKKEYGIELDRNDEFHQQIKKISKTVGTLDKLSKTDEELLQKYSKVYFLNENYIPEKLASIDSQYLLPGKKDQYFHARAIDFLEDLFKAAKDDGHDLKVISAYRSFDEQAQLKGQYTKLYGTGANAFSADQGYSEHQLGTTLDLTVAEVGGTYTSFAQTDAYAWLLAHAHEYGFVLSYPEQNSYYIFEPWHWRFVGEDLARDLKKANAHFYDWEQRKIDGYLVKIFD
jgi:LAS superfamily LD-carboxypeptidase LdcB